MDSDSVASMLPPPAKAKLRKSPRPKVPAPPPEKQGTVTPAEALPEVELVEVKIERDAPPTGETYVPKRDWSHRPTPYTKEEEEYLNSCKTFTRDPVVYVALEPPQVIEFALMAALLAVGIYKLSDAISGVFDHFFPAPE